MELPLLGIPEIDDQHKSLIANLDKLGFWIGKGRGYPAALDALAALNSYVESHFRDEEDFMRRNAYPKLDQHIAEHTTIVSNLATEQQRVLDGNDISEELLAFLTDWLLNHIGESDMDIALFIKSSQTTFVEVSQCP